MADAEVACAHIGNFRRDEPDMGANKVEREYRRFGRLAIPLSADRRSIRNGQLQLPRHRAYATIRTRLLEDYHEHDGSSRTNAC
jgi:hypothetical protein